LGDRLVRLANTIVARHKDHLTLDGFSVVEKLLLC
jgi:hypothetical protein